MPTIFITWHAIGDAKTCKICKDINGYTWIFETGKTILTDALFHPIYGIVWSLSEGSNAHARGYLSGHTYNCRCRITYKITAEDTLAKSVYLAEIIKDLANDVSDTKKGNYRTTRPEDIGIDLSKYGID